MKSGLDCFGADCPGYVGFEWKKAVASAVPAVASAAEDALKDKPKDGAPQPNQGAPVLRPASSSELSTGAKVGIAAGCVAGAGLIGLLVKKIWF